MRYLAVVAIGLLFLVGGCGPTTNTSDSVQQNQQEQILKEGTAETGMPAIKNFRERKLLKLILEMRDQNITTYTYLFSEVTCKTMFFGETIGFGIPYSTQYTNPQKVEWYGNYGYLILPQADPNTLFSPVSAEGTWILMKDPNSKDVKPVYIEPRIIVSPFKLPSD